MLDFLLSLLNRLINDPLWVYTFLFFDALLTTVPVIGVVVLETPIAIFAGFLAAQGHFSVWWAGLWGVIGGIIGDGLGYLLGRKLGLKLVNSPWITSHRHFETAHTFFLRHGGKSIIGARFIGPLRTIIPLIAGIVRMPQPIFWFYNIASSIIWGFVFFPLGYFFGRHWKEIAHWTERGGWAALVIGALVLFWYWRRSISLTRHSPLATPAPSDEPSTSPNEQKEL